MVFSGRTSESLYDPGTTLAKMVDPDAFIADPSRELGEEELMKLGSQVFGRVCAQCHQAQGQGLPGTFPPLAGSDFLMADEKRAIDIVMNGLRGPIVVNGVTYSSEMPKPGLTDVEVAAVLTFVRNRFGNRGDLTTLAEVKEFRDSLNPPTPTRIAGTPGSKPTRKSPTQPVAYQEK
jgi:nitrite reductase (NO-forming)